MSFNPSSTANGAAARGTGPLKNGRPGGDPLLQAVAKTSATVHYSRPNTNQEPSSFGISIGGASPSSPHASVDAAGQAVTPGTSNSRSGSTSDITTSVTGGGSTVTTDTTIEVNPPPTMVRTTIGSSKMDGNGDDGDGKVRATRDEKKTSDSEDSDNDGDAKVCATRDEKKTSDSEDSDDDGDAKVCATRDEKKTSDSEDSDDGEDEETSGSKMDGDVAGLIRDGTVPSAPEASAAWTGVPNRAQRVLDRENRVATSKEKKKAPKRMGSNAGRNSTPSKKVKREIGNLKSPDHALKIIADIDKELSATKTKHSNKVKEIKWVDRLGFTLATIIHELDPSMNVGTEAFFRMRRSMQFEDSNKLDSDVIYALRENFEDYSKMICGEEMTVEEMDQEWKEKQDEDKDDN